MKNFLTVGEREAVAEAERCIHCRAIVDGSHRETLWDDRNVAICESYFKTEKCERLKGWMPKKASPNEPMA